MPNDPYPTYGDSPSAPASMAFPIVPSDSAELSQATKAIYVGTGGNIALRPLHSGVDVVYRNVASGSYLTIRASHVRVTGTTAADLVGEA